MSNKKYTSILFTEPKEDFQNRINKCYSIADVARSLGLAVNSVSYKRIKKRIEIDNIDVSHIPSGKHASKGRQNFMTRAPIESYLVSGSMIGSSALRKRLIRDKLLNNICSRCGLSDTWEGEPITLQLDHINGIRDDNRLENLRILCPNCHSQTDTYGGKRFGTKCIDCNKKITRNCKRCQKCANKITYNSSNKFKQYCQQEKFTITKEELEKLIWEKPTSEIAKLFGVSDKAIEKRCKKYGISKPARGYWQKLNSHQKNKT